MALQQIEPKYLSWVDQNKDIDKMLSNLEKNMVSLHDKILSGKDSDKDIQDNITDMRKKVLYANLLLNDKILSNPSKDWTEDKKLMQNISASMETIDKYEQNNIIINQKKNIDILAWFGAIFLPLTLITGYYGMNFRSMGSPSTNSGPFSWKHGQILVLLLFVFSIIITITLLKQYYK